MANTDRMAGFFIILAGLYYSWNAFVLPVRADEAFIFLKSAGFSWQNIPVASLMEYIIKGSIFLDNTSLNLRMPSIIFISLSALLIFHFTYTLVGKYGAWFSMILFFVTPSVTYAYMSASSSSLFIFASVLYIYSIHMVQCEEKKYDIKYYIWASISQALLISTHYSGILFIILPFIYLIFKRELIKNKYYMITALLGIIYTMIFIFLHMTGLFEFFYKYPLYSTNKKIFIYILLLVIYLPFIYILIIFLKNKKIDENIKFLFVSSVFLGLGGIFFNFSLNYDIRLVAAFIAPTFILAGYFYEVYGYRVLLGIITTILVLTSAYTNISNTSELTPKYMENTRLYESIGLSLQDIVSLGDSVYSYHAGLSSILVYNSSSFVEACTLDDCSGNKGIFISTKRENDLNKYFYEVKEVNIYRVRLAEKKEATTFYFYSVNGLKKSATN